MKTNTESVTATAAIPTGPVALALSETVIRPAGGWELLRLLELWRFRDLVQMLAWRDISVRYKQTALGVAWAVLQPAAMMAVFAGVFGRLARLPSGDLPYPVFVFAGLLPWTFFATAITNAANSVVENERLVTKVYFPRLAIPLAAVGAAFVDFCLAFLVLVVLMLIYGIAPGWNLLALPATLLLLVMSAVGVGSLLAALNVTYRDFRYVVGFLVQLWMFATPSIYMSYPSPGMSDGVAAKASIGPATGTGSVTSHAALTPAPTPVPTPPTTFGFWDLARTLVNLNPMTSLIASFRAVTVGGAIPWSGLALSAAGSLMIFVVGLLYFRRVEDSFADVL